MNHPEGSEFNILFNLSTAQKEGLSQQIASHRGLVRAIIHPYFYDYYPPRGIRTAQQVNSSYDRVVTGHERLLRSTDPHRPVTFVFEATNLIPQTVQKLSAAGVNLEDQTIQLVPTLDRSPTPDPAFVGHKQLLDAHQSDAIWNEFSVFLQQFSIHSFLVSGVIFVIDAITKNELGLLRPELTPFRSKRSTTETTNTNYNLIGCVGYTIHQLTKRGYQVDLSGLVSPNSRIDLARFEKRSPIIC